MKHIISLGAGVQSSRLAMGAALGEFVPMPIAAIFADTNAEPVAVYEWLGWLEKQLPFPVIRVSVGSLALKSVAVTTTKDGERTYLKHSVPVFVLNPDGTKGMARRQCTRDFKIDPIKRAVRKLGANRKIPCTTWIGISTDEAQRMKPSQDAAQVHIWPLVEHGISRDDCLKWFDSKGYPRPPKSACTFCPYHSDAHWLGMPESELQDALRYEEALQGAYKKSTALRGTPFLHNSRVPFPVALARMRIAPKSDATVDMFNNECEGMCGV